MDGRVKLIALVKRAPGLDQAAFEERWVLGHGPLAARLPRLKGYRINVAIEGYQEIEGELPYDGTAEMWWDSVEDMRADFASDEAAIAVPDADEFTLVRTHLITREHVILESESDA